jgi:DNA polymerase-3 subunit epsilon
MRAFAPIFGEWSRRHGSWRWQRLGTAADHVGFVWPGNAHRAIHDCMATRAVWHWTNAQATAISNLTAPVEQRAHRPER